MRSRRGAALPYVIEVDSEFVGQVNVGDIVYGSLRGCHVGYWISQHAANRGKPLSVLTIGDAYDPRTALEAIHEGFKIATEA